jgi:hypothetical protein
MLAANIEMLDASRMKAAMKTWTRTKMLPCPYAVAQGDRRPARIDADA